MIRIYGLAVLIITIAVVMLGFVGPALISSDSHELPLIGIVLMVLTIPALAYLINKFSRALGALINKAL